MKAHTMRFLTTCVDLTTDDIEDLHEMTEKARAITRRTFLRYVDQEDQRAWERTLGYERGGLTMAKDWHVGYYKSTFRGRPCVYFDHSRIEHIFTQRG